jgi:hypothetical protein
VKAFQQAREITADGIVGRVTWINIDGWARADCRSDVCSRMSAVGAKTWAIVDALENEGPAS